MWRRHTETQQLNTTTIMPNQPSAQEHHNCQSSCILILLDCFKRYTRTASDLQSPPAVPLCEFHRGEEGKKKEEGRERNAININQRSREHFEHRHPQMDQLFQVQRDTPRIRPPNLPMPTTKLTPQTLISGLIHQCFPKGSSPNPFSKVCVPPKATPCPNPSW